MPRHLATRHPTLGQFFDLVSSCQANDLKEQGNKALGLDQIDDAIDFYSDAINIDPTNHILFRSFLSIRYPINVLIKLAIVLLHTRSRTTGSPPWPTPRKQSRSPPLGVKATTVWVSVCTTSSASKRRLRPTRRACSMIPPTSR